MSLSFKFIPLTFLNDEDEIKKQIRNTIILKYFFERNSETVRLEDLITGTQYGYNASALVQGRNKFLRISDITDGKVNWKTVPYCNCTDEKTYLLFPNDILIARTGGTTGKSFLISEPPAFSIYAGYLIRIRANEETIPDYLNLFLNSYVYWSQIVSLNEDNFRPSVNAEKLKKLILPKCDQNAQNDAVKISNGELISGYDYLYQLIDETLLKYDKLKEIQVEKANQLNLQKILKQSILLEAIQGKLTTTWREENKDIEPASKLLAKIKNEKAKKINEGKKKKEKDELIINSNDGHFEIPKSWAYARFIDICSFQIGKTPPTKEMDYWVKGEHNWLSISDMIDFGVIQKTQKKITDKAIKNIFNYISISPPETLLMSFKLTVGKVSISNIPLYHNEAIISIYPFEGIERDFLFYFLPQFINLSVGKKVLMGQTFNSESLKKLIIAIPPTKEQKMIVQKAKLSLDNLKQLEDEIVLSELTGNKLMQAVLKDAFEVKEEVIIN
jgi:type I restriction enzyme S subunit